MDINRLQLGYLFNESESWAIIIEGGLLFPIEADSLIMIGSGRLSGFVLFHFDDNCVVDFILLEKDILSLERFSENPISCFSSSYKLYFNSLLYERYTITIPQHLTEKSNKFILKYGDRYYTWYKDSDESIFVFESNTIWERKMLKCFYNKTIYPCDIPSFEDKLIEIDSYLEHLNVDDIIDSFSIENVELCQNRAGRDDYYYIIKTFKELDEEFINSLFPHNNVTIYSDHGYVEASTMRIDFEVRPYLEEERSLKDIARKNYDRDSHRRFLIMKAYDEMSLLSSRLLENTRYVYQKFGEMYTDWIFQTIRDKPIREICQKSNTISTTLRVLLNDRRTILDCDYDYVWWNLFSKKVIGDYYSVVGNRCPIDDITDRVTVFAVTIPQYCESQSKEGGDYYPIIHLTCHTYNGTRYGLSIKLLYKNYDAIDELKQLKPGLCHMHITGVEDKPHCLNRKKLYFSYSKLWEKKRKIYETSPDQIWINQILVIE